jgi:hypothetical protein
MCRYAKGGVQMNMKGLKVKNCLLPTIAVLAMVVFFALAIPAQQASAENESITVSCFKGSSEEGNYIGEISVNRLRDAASDCNQEFPACQGGCLGCVVDSENNQVCYGMDGERISQ